MKILRPGHLSTHPTQPTIHISDKYFIIINFLAVTSSLSLARLPWRFLYFLKLFRQTNDPHLSVWASPLPTKQTGNLAFFEWSSHIICIKYVRAIVAAQKNSRGFFYFCLIHKFIIIFDHFGPPPPTEKPPLGTQKGFSIVVVTELAPKNNPFLAFHFGHAGKTHTPEIVVVIAPAQKEYRSRETNEKSFFLAAKI